ncbi:HEAT repeat domain-containing protein [Thalassoroseus pseudoceratinae]|uniref:HEAT repeat domain-containing protein n=1 Tax=Thalassoroseus pseudoceratinae TaxID=2713176 RepID=UPI001423B183|nr:HEAT repeat domain-containing protein [Thalassoroseus pseudoceratinae]
MVVAILACVAVLGDPSTTYDGLTLDEWRERMKSLELDNPESRSAVSGMVAIVKDTDVPWFTRRQAALTLGRLGPIAEDAVPVLGAILKEPDAGNSTRIWIGKALALFGAEAATVAPTAIEILQTDQSSLGEKQVMIELLGRIGSRHPQALPALIETLGMPPPADKNAARDVNTLRALAGESLATVGSDAIAAVPALTRTLYDENELVRRRAVEALGAIGPAASVSQSALLETMIFDESAAVRDSAAVSLSDIGPAVMESVTGLLADRDPEVRTRAAGILGRLGPKASASVVRLEELLNDEAASVRIQAIEAIWQITEEAKTVIPAAITALAETDRQHRIRAYRLLIEIGQSAPGIVREALTKVENDSRPTVRQAARKVLRTLDEAKSKSAQN